MSVQVGQQETLVGLFRIGVTEEVRACVFEQDGHPFMEIQVHQLALDGHSTVAAQGIRIPAALLPELKHLVQRLEEHLTEQGLAEAVHTLDRSQAERGPIFAHPSEAAFARILDFYKIRWQYEPRTFPIRWDAQGHALESFTPDFYLPEQDLYIELTTRKQALVTKKNRKLRLLKQLHPEVNIKILYGRDFQGLLQKYGIRQETH